MAKISIDTDALAAQLSRAVNQDLGFCTLQPGLLAGQTVDPSLLPTVPTIMAVPLLIPGVRYRFGYRTTRYLRLTYLVGRAGLYESGSLDIISDETPWVGEPSTFTPPNLGCLQQPYQLTGAVGVSFSTLVDDSTLNSDTPKFGIAYRITTSSPNQFPTVVMTIATAISIEGA